MTNVDKWSGANPWLGLASYTEENTLYGRDKETVVLSDVIKNNIATTVFGKSGVGKSSLISAGISHVLSEDMYIPVKIRLVHNSDVSYVEQIENAVRSKVVCTDNLPTTIKDLGLWDFFHRHSFTTKDGEDCTPVVILDQFEEIFTLTDEDHKPCIREFFQDLSSLLNNIKPDKVKEVERDHNVTQASTPTAGTKKLVIKRVGTSSLQYNEGVDFRFVLCLREDKLYLLERNSANIPSLKTNRFNLQALSVESAMEVVTRPRPGLFSEKEAQERIDELADMGDEGTHTVDPAILSLYMYKYYEKRGTASTGNIFADYYNEATKVIRSKSIAYLEKNLLTNGGYRNQLPIDDALSGGVTQDEINTLLKSVILRTEKRKGIEYIEFSHDRLCAEAKKNREERIVHEQARKARKRIMLSFFVFAVSAGILAYVFLLSSQLQTAEEQNDIINRQKQEIALQRDSIDKSLKFQESQNHLILIQKGEIATQRDSIRMSLQEQEKQNKQLKSQMAVIEEQQRRIDELQSGSKDALNIVNRKAGRLSEVLPYSAVKNAVSLTISGDLNGTDIKYLRDNGMGNLRYLNLADANIVRGGAVYYYYGNEITENNVIGPSMFRDWLSLKTIILPRNITVIGDDAFDGCYFLSSITIPNGVTTIGGRAFWNCHGLSSVTIPNSVTSIGNEAFEYCSGLTSITIPSSVKYIGENAFAGCALYDFINNSSCASDDFWGALVSESPRNDGFVIRDSVLLRCKVDSGSVIIPDGVASIGEKAFGGCWRLSSITIPNSVAYIEHDAFAYCSRLTSITIPNSVTAIDDRAFANCYELVSVTIPNSVTYIGNHAFEDCSALATVNIPNGVTSIDESTFEDCSSLTSVVIPNSVTTIGINAFSGCTSLASINIPNSVSFIAGKAFEGCRGLSSVTIPNGVTTISAMAFQNCSGLLSVTIPKSVNVIGDLAFYGCANLNHIYSEIEDVHRVFAGGLITGASTQFTGIPSTCTWHIPVGKSREYKSQSWWVPTWNIVEDINISKNVKTSYKNGLLKVNDFWYNLLPVEGGTFLMGTSDELIAAGFKTMVMTDSGSVAMYEFERPVHQVTLDSYRIGETEVTQALWTAVMGYNPSAFKGDNLPVDNVSWDECQYFIYKLNTLTGKQFRMPTEAEWEFAARGGNKSKRTPYSGSNNPEEIGWFVENSGKRTHPVKQKRPNELGIYDMCGNVMEFCLDKYSDYDSEPQKNPIGTSEEAQRIVRGGSADDSFQAVYVSLRLICEPDEKYKETGLRLAISEE